MTQYFATIKALGREERLSLTQFVTCTISQMSGLSPTDLNRHFFPAGSEGHNKNGLRFQRYQRRAQALSQSELDRMIRRALVQGWWPLADPGEPLWALASGGVMDLIQQARQGKVISNEEAFAGAPARREAIIERSKQASFLRRKVRRQISALTEGLSQMAALESQSSGAATAQIHQMLALVTALKL